MGTGVLSTGDKILYIMKDMDMGIPGLAALSGVRENTLLDIMAGIREADISTLCRIADALGVCVRELCPDQEQYTLPAFWYVNQISSLFDQRISQFYNSPSS